MSTAVTVDDEGTYLLSAELENRIGNGVRQRGSNVDNEEEAPRYFIRPFREGAASLSWLQAFIKEVSWLVQQRDAQWTLVLVAVNLVVTLLLLSWCHSTRSMALMAYTYLSWFSLLNLVTGLVCVWAEHQQATMSFMYGYLRCEALAVFSSVMLSLLGAVIIVKESVERLLEPELVHTGMLSIGGLLGLMLHLGMTTLAHNPPLTQVLRASQSSLLQEHVTDMCQSLCTYIPTLARILLPRVDPVVLISVTGFLAILGDHFILQIYNYQAADSVAALVIALLTITTMYPLCVCSACVLLQTTPASTFAQLDKCLREALTLDGVLEFRHEKFWTLGVLGQPSRSTLVTKDSSGFILTGSLHVRIRRDANEQLVLAHIREKLSPLVPLLTVQVFKDDWTRSSTTLQLLNNSARTLATSPSHSPHYVNVTYPQVYTSRTPTTNSSSYPPQIYFPSLPHRSPFPQGNAATVSSIPPLSPTLTTSSRSSVFSTTKNFADSTSNISTNEANLSFSQTHVEKELSSSDPSLYGKSYSKGNENAMEFVSEKSPENEISLQSWKDGKETSGRRETHSQKPSPYYVNVDFSGRSHLLSSAVGTVLENTHSSISSHTPR